MDPVIFDTATPQATEGFPIRDRIAGVADVDPGESISESAGRSYGVAYVRYPEMSDFVVICM